MPKPSTLWVGPPELAILLIFRPGGLGAARRATATAGRRSWRPVFPPESDLFSEIASAGRSVAYAPRPAQRPDYETAWKASSHWAVHAVWVGFVRRAMLVEGPVPPGPRDAVERIPPCPPSASEVAKRLECARLLALSDHPTAPGDLRLHSCLPQTTRWVAQPITLPIRGPGSTRPVSRSSSEPPDCLRCRDPKRRLRRCAGIKCAPAAKFRKKSLSGVCAGKLSQLAPEKCLHGWCGFLPCGPPAGCFRSRTRVEQQRVFSHEPVKSFAPRSC